MRRRGFTLIEIMLVVVIIAITTVVAVPMFVKSLQSSRMQLSTRTLIKLHRYARTQAILENCRAELKINSETGELEMTVLTRGKGEAQETMKKKLEDGISVSGFKCETRDEEDGAFTVAYTPGGRCAEFTVELEDEHGRQREIFIDGISGKATVTE